MEACKRYGLYRVVCRESELYCLEPRSYVSSPGLGMRLAGFW